MTPINYEKSRFIESHIAADPLPWPILQQRSYISGTSGKFGANLPRLRSLLDNLQ